MSELVLSRKECSRWTLWFLFVGAERRNPKCNENQSWSLCWKKWGTRRRTLGLDWERKTPKMCYHWEKKLLRKHWSFFFLGVKIVVGVKTGESCVNPILSGLIELLRAQSSVTESWISWCHKKEDIVSYQMLLAISKIFSQVQVISKLISVSFFSKHPVYTPI